ncbi:uncharacterized protein LOC105832315 isoform X2 [Monomorium pharaonis]|uniref:uncharacterized protein LOC105832315 isoform X2 n=1 Tax=Monomorium pharaonis TaxID=307658 RepID=UPI0017465A0B|nr:uncharacterized protein LOC105832315 isoform X2 [Monomorium pharaonis]
MFLLHCEKDDSLLICNESDVICENNVGKGDTVQFVYNEKIYLGTVIEHSENEKELETHLTKLRSEKQKQTGQSQSIVEGRRHSIQNKKYKDCILPSDKRKKKITKKMHPKKKIKKSKHEIHTKQTQLHQIMNNVDLLECSSISFSDSETLSPQKQEDKIQAVQNTSQSTLLEHVKPHEHYIDSENNNVFSKTCNDTSSVKNELSLEDAIRTISTLKAKICELERKQPDVGSSSSNNVIITPANVFHKRSSTVSDKENINRNLSPYKVPYAVPSTSKYEHVSSPRLSSKPMKELHLEKGSMYHGKNYCVSQHLASRNKIISLPCSSHESATSSTLSRTSSSVSLKSDLFSKTNTPCQTSPSATDDMLSSDDNSISSNTDRCDSPINQETNNETNVRNNEEKENLQEKIIYEARQEHQLYGKDWPDETMILLRDGIFCRQSVLLAALGHACKASHIVRRLVQGVFKIETIMNATVTGQAPRATARDKSMQTVPLDGKAKMAIINEHFY